MGPGDTVGGEVTTTRAGSRTALTEIALAFLRLGATAFGAVRQRTSA